MPAYKDSKTGTWFVKFYCKDWTGENKQIKKRGFDKPGACLTVFIRQ